MVIAAFVPAYGETAGEFDGSFDGGMSVNGRVEEILPLPDGKLYLRGEFTTVRGGLRRQLARLNADGTIDESFDAAIPSGIFTFINDFVVQADGKLVVVGSFTTFAGTLRNDIVRLNLDGSVDTSFDPGSGSDLYISNVILQPNGQILIAGEFTQYDGTARANLARVNADGSLDEDFNPGAGPNGLVRALAIQPDGKIVLGGEFTTYDGNSAVRIARISEDGSYDGTFNVGAGASGTVLALAVQSDGKIVLGGSFATINGTAGPNLARVDEFGAIDPDFDVGSGPNSQVKTIIVSPDGKLLIQGGFLTYNGLTRRMLARVNPDGSDDTSFLRNFATLNRTAGTGESIDAVALQEDGKIFIGGFFNGHSAQGITNIARLSSNGFPDPTFIPDGGAAGGDVLEVISDLNGDVIVAGTFTSYRGLLRRGVARLGSDGTPDPNFDSGVVSSGSVTQLALQQDSKILVGGSFTSLAGVNRSRFARLNANGSIDADFNPGTGPNSSVSVITVQKDGKSLIGGFFSRYNNVIRNRIARVNADGSLDESFDPGTGFNGSVSAIAVLDDGTLLVGGDFTSCQGQTRHGIAKLSANGALEEMFSDELVGGSVGCISPQADGKVIIAGSLLAIPEFDEKYILRLNSDGSRDLEFGAPVMSIDGISNSPVDFGGISEVITQADEKIVIIGRFYEVNSVRLPGIARLNRDGSLDTDFDNTSEFFAWTDVLTSVSAQSDGRLMVAGLASYFGEGRKAPFRLSNSEGIQELSLAGNSGVQWMRSGSLPELSHVNFEKSIDGVNWSSLKSGSRRTAGWEANDLDLQGIGYVRALGRTVGRTASLIEQVVRFNYPNVVTFDGDSLASYDHVIEPGEVHQYEFSVEEPRVVVFSATGDAELRAVLKDAEGTVIAEFDGDDEFVISSVLRPGAYQMDVFRVAHTGNPQAYRLAIDSSEPALVLPDVSLGASSASLIGKNRFLPAIQSATLVSRKSKPVRGVIDVANRGKLPDIIALRGGRGNALFAVRYSSSTGNVTAAVQSGTFLTPELSSEDLGVSLVATISPNKRKLTLRRRGRVSLRRVTFILPVQVTSMGTPRKSDGAKFRVMTR